MLVREAMESRVHAIAPGQSIAEAARTMRDAGTGFLPVVDGGAPGGAS